MVEIGKYLKSIPGNELYNDLFKPGMQKAGEALSSVIDGANLILLPLKLVNAKSRIYFDNNIEKYSKKLNANTALTLTQVPQYVGLPIVDKLIYLDQNELAEAFINLLIKASFEESLKLAHPAYISILERLSADEAKILFYFKNQERIPFLDFYIHRYIKKIESLDTSLIGKAKIQQMIDYTYQDTETVFIKAAWNLTGIENTVDLLFPENIDIYIENLEINGLITFERILHTKTDLPIYEKLLNEDYKEQLENVEKQLCEFREEHASKDDYLNYKFDIDIRKGYIEFSALGRGFLDACIKDIE